MARFGNLVVFPIFMALLFLPFGSSEISGHGWELAHATFYGDMEGNETMRKFVLFFLFPIWVLPLVKVIK